jgi:MoaA/NifB/PqqE/SkfB family radical SAM enzyme
LGSSVQFIGGEPTMAPLFPEIFRHALNSGMGIEVYSNLVHITPEVWDLLSAPNASLAFSYYAADADAHNAVTLRPSHGATRRNAEKAVGLGIAIRAGVIETGSGYSESDVADLHSIGVTNVRVDRVRSVGRGGPANDVAQLCGRCGNGIASINSNGDVTPCVFSRWLSVGNVRETPLGDILAGRAMVEAVATIPAQHGNACDPDTECSPGSPGSECSPRNQRPCPSQTPAPSSGR